MSNKTFAFSNKFNKWATRYSFTPSWYGSVDKHLLSSQSDGGSVWEHDVNETRCSFYGTEYKSKLVVASNQDPSEVKVFNALSLETNGDKWAADIKTNEEEDTQEGSVGYLDWKEKEGFLYANMPKSSTLCSSSISYAGSSKLGFMEWMVAFGNYYGIPGGVEGEGVALINPLIGTTDGFTIDVKIDRSEVPLATGDGCKMYFDYESAVNSGLAHLAASGIEITDLSNQGPASSAALNELELDGIYGDVLRIRYKNTTGILWEGDWMFWGPQGNPPTSPFARVWVITLLCRFSIYIMSPPHINGDNLGGPYAKMELSYDASTPMQVSAINVDYRFSDAEDRLTQNT